MQRFIGIVAALALTASLWGAQKSGNGSTGFQPAEIVSSAELVYPVNSIAAGTVVLQLTVGSSGQVEDTQVIRDIPSLTQAAVRSARKWTFRPATLDGKAIRSKVAAAFTFVRPVVVPTH